MKRSRKEKSPALPREETWTDSAVWGATMTLFLVISLLAGAGYVGYTNLEHPRQPARLAAPHSPTSAAVREASRLR